MEENLNQFPIILESLGDNMIIKSLKKHETVPEPQQQYQLSSLFGLLGNGNLNHLYPSLQKITLLDLSHCALSDLPKTLKLSHLKELNLSHNKLTKIPSCLYGNSLDELEILDLSHNLLENFEVQPDCVATLKILRLNNNSLGNVPPWFLTFRCVKLEEFDYSENGSKHFKFLNHRCNFSIAKLRKLELRNVCLIDRDTAWLQSFKNLQYLDISNKSLEIDTKYINKFKTVDGLFSKPRWKEMKILKLEHLSISFFPSALFWLDTLTELHMSNNLLSWFPDGLEYLVNLEHLDVSCNSLVFIPSQLSQLPKLKCLLAYKNIIQEMPILPSSLETLDFYDNHVHSVASIALSTLKYVDLEYNFVCLYSEKVDYEDYCMKRDTFRANYGFKDRYFDVKAPSELCCDSDEEYSGYSSDREYSNCDIPSNDGTNYSPVMTYEENWDAECEEIKSAKHPGISSSDDEFDGESGSGYAATKRSAFVYLYLEGEDWYFQDAD